MYVLCPSEDSDLSKDSDQLIWVFAGRTGHFVGFAIRRLKWYGYISNSSGMAKTLVHGKLKGTNWRVRQQKIPDSSAEWINILTQEKTDLNKKCLVFTIFTKVFVGDYSIFCIRTDLIDWIPNDVIDRTWKTLDWTGNKYYTSVIIHQFLCPSLLLYVFTRSRNSSTIPNINVWLKFNKLHSQYIYRSCLVAKTFENMKNWFHFAFQLLISISLIYLIRRICQCQWNRHEQSIQTAFIACESQRGNACAMS